MAGDPGEDDFLDASLFFLSSKRMSRDFLRQKDEAVVKVLSILTEEEVTAFGSLDEAINELRSINELGRGSEVTRMASLWRQSRINKL